MNTNKQNTPKANEAMNVYEGCSPATVAKALVESKDFDSLVNALGLNNVSPERHKFLTELFDDDEITCIFLAAEDVDQALVLLNMLEVTPKQINQAFTNLLKENSQMFREVSSFQQANNF